MNYFNCAPPRVERGSRHEVSIPTDVMGGAALSREEIRTEGMWLRLNDIGAGLFAFVDEPSDPHPARA